jgi:solute carrier family 25 oxoglutarate transporter 11
LGRHSILLDYVFFLYFFRVLTNKAVEANDGKPLPLVQKALIGLTAGAIGACFGSPADLALIRMQADSTLPAAQRRNYKNAFHGIYRIIADEGVLALWKGAGPTVARAMSLNMGMLASYDQSVELLRDKLGAGEMSTMLGKTMLFSYLILQYYVFSFRCWELLCILRREAEWHTDHII